MTLRSSFLSTLFVVDVETWIKNHCLKFANLFGLLCLVNFICNSKSNITLKIYFKIEIFLYHKMSSVLLEAQLQASLLQIKEENKKSKLSKKQPAKVVKAAKIKNFLGQFSKISIEIRQLNIQWLFCCCCCCCCLLHTDDARVERKIKSRRRDPKFGE